MPFLAWFYQENYSLVLRNAASIGNNNASRNQATIGDPFYSYISAAFHILLPFLKRVS